jgi:cholesterol oxidase
MTGFKLIKDDAGFDVWKDTTTLFTRVLQGHVAEGDDETATVLASGIIVIRARDFAKQLTTFRGQVGAMAKFGVIFAQQLAEAYLRKGRRHGVHA